jgi:hypothetical protein
MYYDSDTRRRKLWDENGSKICRMFIALAYEAGE